MSYNNAGGAVNQLARSSNCGDLIMFWCKITSYGGGDFVFNYDGFQDSVPIWTNTTNTVLSGAVFGGHSGSTSILTGSNTHWVFVCIVAVNGVGPTFYWRLEGASTLSTASLADAQVVGVSDMLLMSANGSSGFADRVTAYKEWATSTALTPAQILAESSQNAPIVATGLVNYLPCDAGHTIGVDQSGGGNNWSVTGTITTNADEPNMALPAAVVPAIFSPRRRAPGFPPTAPFPGVPRLGVGLLVPSTFGTSRTLGLLVGGKGTLTNPLLAARPLVDNVAGAATFLAPLKAARPLADGLHGAATLTASAPAVARGMTDAVHGAATLTASPFAVARAMAAAVHSAATLAQALSVARSLTLTAHGQATLGALLGKAFHLALAAQGQATVADALAVQRALADVIGGHATLTPAQVLIARGMADAIGGSVVLTEALKAARPLSMGIAGVAQVLATFGPGTLVLALAIHAAASMADPLKVARALAATLNGHATTAEALLVSRTLTAALQARATTTDTLSVARPLADAMHSAASMTGALSRLRPLAAAVAAGATVTNAAKVARALNLAMKGQAALQFSLGGAIVALAMAILGSATTSPTTKVFRGLASTVEGQANLSAALSFLIHLAVSIAGDVTLTSPTSIARGFQLHALARASVLEQLSIARAFGLSLDANAFLQASFVPSVPPIVIHGAIAVAPAIVGTMDVEPAISGTLSFGGISGHLTVE